MTGYALAFLLVAVIAILQWTDDQRSSWPARYKRQRADLSRVLPSRVWRRK